MDKKKTKKTTLPSLKSLHNKLWKLTKEEVRFLYPWNKCYICGSVITEKKKSHTGHLFKIGSLPLQLKYDLRLLRPCCVTCNLFKDGNESWYMIKMIKEVGLPAVLTLVDDIENTVDLEGVVARREWYLQAINDLKLPRVTPLTKPKL